jgi:ferredoxin
MIPIIEIDLCTGCGNCVGVCPPQALSLLNGKVVIEHDLCEECGFCAPQCAIGAVTIPFPVFLEQ